MRLVWLTVGALALFLALPGDGKTEKGTRRLSAEPDGAVEIRVPSTSLRILGWDRPEVEVEAEGLGNPRALTVEKRGRRVEIGLRSGGGRLTVRLPEASELRVETRSAAVEISGVVGALDLGTISGSFDLLGSSGHEESPGKTPELLELRASTISGRLLAKGNIRRAELESVSGRLELEGAVQDLEATVVSGRIRLHSSSIGKARLESVSGPIEVRGGLGRGTDLRAENHNGSIKVYLPAEADCRLRANTHSGRIGGELAGIEARTDPRHLDLTLGQGRAKVEIETFSGSISLHRSDL